MKKRSEMSTDERMEFILTGASWDDAEKVGIEILARCMAFHVYSLKEDEDYMNDLFDKICHRADEWAHEPINTRYLALAAVADRMEKSQDLSCN